MAVGQILAVANDSALALIPCNYSCLGHGLVIGIFQDLPGVLLTKRYVPFQQRSWH